MFINDTLFCCLSQEKQDRIKTDIDRGDYRTIYLNQKNLILLLHYSKFYDIISSVEFATVMPLNVASPCREIEAVIMCACTLGDSKGSRPRHSRRCESSRFLAISRKCFIFLEFWMKAFYNRPCKSRAKFKLN